MKRLTSLSLMSLTTIIVLVGCNGNSSGSTTGGLYGTLKDGSTAPATSIFVSIDQTSGEVTEIGNVGYLVNGLEYDASSSTWYATTSTKDATCPTCLLTIDEATGAGTEVGPMGVGDPAEDYGPYMNPTCNSSGEMYGWSEYDDTLISINKDTGMATEIDPAIGSAVHGLAFDANDQLWFYNEGGLYSIDPDAGTDTFIAEIDYAHHGDFNFETGEYFGLNDYDGSDRQIVVYDGETLLRTLPTITTDLHTLAFKN